MADQIFGGGPRVLPFGTVLQQFDRVLKVDTVSGKSEKLKRFLQVGREGGVCVDFRKVTFQHLAHGVPQLNMPPDKREHRQQSIAYLFVVKAPKEAQFRCGGEVRQIIPTEQHKEVDRHLILIRRCSAIGKTPGNLFPQEGRR